MERVFSPDLLAVLISFNDVPASPAEGVKPPTIR